jgi:hypothetical protein
VGTGAITTSIVPGFGGASLEDNMCAVAVGRYGAGFISFFGDVNAETSTLDTVTTLCRGRTRDPMYWSPKKEVYRRCPRTVKQAIVTVLLVGARLRVGDVGADGAVALPAMPWEVWYHVLSMTPSRTLGSRQRVPRA